MADFSPPFAENGERREPTVDEQDGGFACGPADMLLFNWLFWSLQTEVVNVITAAGLAPSNESFTQLRDAINELISAATGGGDPSVYVTMAQARARLPIFPDVQTVTGKMGLITPALNQIRIPAGVTFRHRGIYELTTSQVDLALDSSKTYHIRWNPTDGFTAKDVSNAVYNPGALVESNVAFDSSYDDMLVARAVVNSSGNVTVTNLINKDRLFGHVVAVGSLQAASGANGARYGFAATLDWARTPKSKVYNLVVLGSNSQSPDRDRTIYNPYPTAVNELPATRYGSSFDLMLDGATGITLALDFGA